MAERKIISIGMPLPGVDNIDHAELEDKTFLSDYDIIIIDPFMRYIYGKPRTYKDLPVLSADVSHKFKKISEHWKSEIINAINSNSIKNIFFFLNEKEEVYFSNALRPNYGSTYSNYEIVSFAITAWKAGGKFMKVAEKNKELTSYMNKLGKVSEYRVALGGRELQPTVQMKKDEQIVAGKFQLQKNYGNIFFMPYIDFWKYTENDVEDWTDEAKEIAAKLVYHIRLLDKATRDSSGATPPPSWIANYPLPKEEAIESKINCVQEEINSLQTKKQQLKNDKAEESILSWLLYENGKPLEKAVRAALELLEFVEVSNYHVDGIEIDVIFTSKEARLIGEVEGKDNSHIDINKFRQLQDNVIADYQLSKNEEKAKGVLIGNAYRLTEPSKRTDFFTHKCIISAESSCTALIKTTDLFEVAKYLSSNDNAKYATECRKAIINAAGLVKFPPILEK